MITIKINNEDKTNYVNWKSFRINNILTKQVDTCNFTIQNYEGKVYKPELEDDVQVFKDLDKIFGGNIKRITQESESAKIISYKIECADYTRQMDKKKVAEIYENKTVNEIIADMKNKYFPDFNIDNVNCSIVIPYILFNYEIPSQCFQRLVDLTGYDWYVDCDKNIYFFEKGNNPAPFNLDDDGAKYIFDSLNINYDTSQIRNGVFVRGAEFLGEPYTEKIISTGTPTVYNLAYKYADISLKVGGVSKTLGLDNIDDENDFDCLFNFQEKLIRFREDNKPANGVVIEFTGKPYVPLIVYRSDNDSKMAYGEFQHYVYDAGIQDQVSAERYADAMLKAYKDPLIKGNFQTYETGLKAGQDLIIQSTIKGINEQVIIDKVSVEMISPTELIYDIDFTSSKDIGIIELLADLVLKKSMAEFRTDEIVYKTFTFTTEQMTLTDSTPIFKDKYTSPWYVAGGSTPVGICGFCQAS